MRGALWGAVAFIAVSSAVDARAPAVAPFERPDEVVPATRIDELVGASLQVAGIESAYLCSDEVFVRRAHLDIIGTLPEPLVVRAFLQDRRPEKRARLIDSLLERPEFADYWAMKWCDVLRVKAEFPINLWPNAVQCYQRWVREAMATNKPYDLFARELLTSSGSAFRVPPANFYRAVQGRKPEDIAGAVALTFMGTRLASWPQTERENLARFFFRVAYKKTDEWKEEIVCLDPTPLGPFDATLPDGTAVHIAADQDPRQVFADWLLADGNPWFARAIVNRVWAWLLGRGIVEEPDDIRPDNPPSNPELLAYLEQAFVASHYDLKALYRLILTSRTYQQSSIPQSDGPEAAALFAYYPVRQLEAEVLNDALRWLGAEPEHYISAIPEPFTYVPDDERAIELADGSISSSFLEMFGRPARDTGTDSERSGQPTDAQRLYTLNSTDIRRMLETSPRLRAAIALRRGNRRDQVTAVYYMVLSRPPTPTEVATASAYLEAGGRTPKQAVEDLAWALINTKEFLCRH